MAIKPKLFVITALQRTENDGKAELNIVYYAEDYASGGYPYWTTRFSQARMFDSVFDPNIKFTGCAYMYDKTSLIEMFEIVLESHH